MKTAMELAITPYELDALIVVRDGLQCGAFRHRSEEEQDFKKPGFNMASFHCGSAGCIGGWVGNILAGGNLTPEVMRIMEHDVIAYSCNCSKSLDTLYYPNDKSCYSYSEITPIMAVQAIDNFLETGDPKWDDVVGCE